MVQYEYFFKSNGNTPPTTPTNNNGYIFVHIPSHAIIAKGSVSPDARPQVEFQIIDPDGNEVVYLKDTVSGYHPNYFNLPILEADLKASFERWKNNFNGFGPFGSAEDRGNNHKGELFNFHLKEGVYKWIYRNMGNTPNIIQAGFVRTNQHDFQETIAPGQTVIKELHIFKRRAKQGGDETYDIYKLNTNYY